MKYIRLFLAGLACLIGSCGGLCPLNNAQCGVPFFFPFSVTLASSTAVMDLQETADGGLIAGGIFTGTKDFGCGPLTATPTASYYLVRLNGATGACVWSRLIPGESLNDFADRHIQLDAAGEVVVSGSFRGTFDFGDGPRTASSTYELYVAKFYGATGKLVWAKNYVSNSPAATYNAGHVGIDPLTNDVVVAGTYEGSLDLGGTVLSPHGSTDMFVAKLSASTGNTVWALGHGGSSPDEVKNMTIVGSTHFAVTGLGRGDNDWGCGAFPNLNDKGVLVGLYRTSDGACEWSIRSSQIPTGEQQGWYIQADSNEDLYVSGYFNDQVNFGGPGLGPTGQTGRFIAKLRGTDGAQIWLTGYVNNSLSATPYFILDDDGLLYAVDTLFGNPSFPNGFSFVGLGARDIYVYTLSMQTGVFQSVAQYGTTSDDYGLVLRRRQSTHQLVVGGLISQTLTFGDTTLSPSSPGVSTGFLVEF